MTRPPLISSSVSAIFASSAGLRKPVQATSVPRWTRRVASATALSIDHTSQMPRLLPSGMSTVGTFPGGDRRKIRWSGAMIESNPTSSPRFAISRSAVHGTGLPSPSAPTPIGSVMPSFIRLFPVILSPLRGRPGRRRRGAAQARGSSPSSRPTARDRDRATHRRPPTHLDCARRKCRRPTL